jgi:hypothetical protein
MTHSSIIAILHNIDNSNDVSCGIAGITFRKNFVNRLSDIIAVESFHSSNEENIPNSLGHFTLPWEGKSLSVSDMEFFKEKFQIIDKSIENDIMSFFNGDINPDYEITPAYFEENYGFIKSLVLNDEEFEKFSNIAYNIMALLYEVRRYLVKKTLNHLHR